MIKAFIFGFAVMFVFLCAGPSFALGGYDRENNTDVDLVCDELPREGQELELFDFRSGQYSEVFVESREDFSDGGALLELSDSQTGMLRRVDVRAGAAQKAARADKP